MTNDEALIKYLLRLGDNALVLAQRLSELVASGPELEEELATANFALDYLGQARMYYSRACELEGRGRSEDDIAYLRGEREFQNFLLLEQPNGRFGDTIVRQVLFD
ncbi:MAG: Phenylacetic acid catabolic protein, partial [Woeseiaceae bacterium]